MTPQSSCMAPQWFHDGSDAASLTHSYEFTKFLRGFTMFPRWRRTAARETASPSDAACVKKEACQIAGNFRTCLNQTGANCFLRFDFWGGETPS